MLHDVIGMVTECIELVNPNVIIVNDGDDFREVLSFDSLDEVELVMAIEDKFSLNMNLPDDAFLEYKSKADLAKYLEREITSGKIE